MKNSLHRIVRSPRSLLILVLFGTVLGGCADIITYSRDSRKEGLKLYGEQQYADAAGAFRNAIRQNSLDYQSCFYLGQSYEALGQHQQAIASFRTSLDVARTSFEGKHDDEFRRNILNGYAEAVGKYDPHDAETDSIEQKAKAHGLAEDWFLLAKVFAYRGDADSAIDAYRRAATAAPQSFDIAKEYGLYLERLGQNQQAEPMLRRAYGLNNQDDQVIVALRRIGVVPGPSLKDQSALAKPLIPKGPIPEVDMSRFTGGSHNSNVTSGATESASAPRD